MEKLLIALALVLFVQHPDAIAPNKEIGHHDLRLGKVNTAPFDQKSLALDLVIEGSVSPRSKTVLNDVYPPSVYGDPDITGWTSASISHRYSNSVLTFGKGREAQDGGKAVGHHLEASAGLITSHTGENYADGGQKHTERGKKSDERIEPVSLDSNQVGITNSRCVGPLCAEVGFLRSVSLLIAIAAVVFGELFSILVLAVFRPIFTRWWYVDALLGQIVAMTGFVCVGEIVLGSNP